VVLADDHADLDQLALVVVLGQGGPGGSEITASRCSSSAARRRAASDGRPARRPGAVDDPGYLRVAHPRSGRCRRADPTRTRPGSSRPSGGSAIPGRGPGIAAVEEVATEARPPFEEPGMTDQGGEDVQISSVHPERIEQRLACSSRSPSEPAVGYGVRGADGIDDDDSRAPTQGRRAVTLRKDLPPSAVRARRTPGRRGARSSPRTIRRRARRRPTTHSPCGSPPEAGRSGRSSGRPTDAWP
jgi:hypothetical protein